MWAIKTTDRFDDWFTSLNDSERASVLAALLVLREKGPGLSRAYADTLKGSRHSNMKELRIQNKGDPLRAFFAFDPNVRVLCFVQAIRSVMKGDFTMRCSSLRIGNTLAG